VQVSVPARDSFALHEFYGRAAQRLAALPNVVSTTAGSSLPFTGNWSSTSFEREGDAGRAGERSGEAQQRVVLPGFFRKMGIPLRAGRDFAEEDRSGAPRVLVINETMARAWPGESPLGKRIRYHGFWWEIVGVVADVKFRRLSSENEATVYASHAQRPGVGMNLVVRAKEAR
jgi:hypothetical protein